MTADIAAHTTITIKPGDRLIFRFEEYLSPEDARMIKDKIQLAIGDDIPILVIGKGINVSVYRQDEESTAKQ